MSQQQRVINYWSDIKTQLLLENVFFTFKRHNLICLFLNIQ